MPQSTDIIKNKFMASNITTSINAMIDRAIESVIDSIAIEGLELLRGILETSGFQKSEYLKNYELYSHVKNGEIEYEILLDLESVDVKDEENLEEVEPEEEEEDSRTYTIPTHAKRAFSNARRVLGIGPRMADARKSLNKDYDARISAHDARVDVRKNALGRSTERKVAAPSPRNMRIDRYGKLAISVQKKAETGTDGKFNLPKKNREGIVGEFIEKLQKLVSEKFLPEFEKILEKKL